MLDEVGKLSCRITVKGEHEEEEDDDYYYYYYIIIINTLMQDLQVSAQLTPFTPSLAHVALSAAPVKNP